MSSDTLRTRFDLIWHPAVVHSMFAAVGRGLGNLQEKYGVRYELKYHFQY